MTFIRWDADAENFRALEKLGWRFSAAVPREITEPTVVAWTNGSPELLPGVTITSWMAGIGRVRVIRVHLAYPTALFALAPLAWLGGFVRRRRRTRRGRAGLCTQCGYDLRASPDRCPECGTVPAR